MLNEIKSKISDCLTDAGFSIYDCTDNLLSPDKRHQYVGIIGSFEAQKGESYEAYDGSDSFGSAEMTVRVRLMGRCGDCSDREVFESMRFAFYENILRTGELSVISAHSGEIKLNGQLSRLESEVTIKISESFGGCESTVSITLGEQQLRLYSFEYESAAKVSRFDTANKGIRKVVLGLNGDTFIAKGRARAEDFEGIKTLFSANLGKAAEVSFGETSLGSPVLSSAKCSLKDRCGYMEFSLVLEVIR